MENFLKFFEGAKKLFFPLENREELSELKCGDPVLISGWVLCGRDATHRKILQSVERGEFSIDLKNQLFYYVGPTPAPPGKEVGSAGPTTSSRMDAYMEFMLKAGIAGSLGKGKRSKEVRELLKKYKGIYLSTFGGAGAFLSRFIKKVECLLWEDLGPEALFRMKVEDFPAIVAIDTQGNDFFEY